MDTALHLPPHWRPDATLQHIIPAPHDYRTFKRLPENPTRYAACIVGSGVFDISDRRFLEPDTNGKSARRRYRLNLGINTKASRVFYSRIICLLVYGPAPSPKYEAHHVDGTNTHDDWRNLRWQTGTQNRAVEIERQAAKRRTGETNGRHTLDHAQLATFIALHDDDTRNRRTPDLQRYAGFFSVSVRQLQRILAGHSRAEEVEEIRKRIRAERRIDPRKRHDLAQYTRTGNPFLDAASLDAE